MAIEVYNTKSGVRYKATLWHHNKVIESASFNRKVDAHDWLRRKKVDLQDRKIGRLRGQTVTLRDFFKNVYSVHHDVRPATWPDYQRIYQNHFDKKFGGRMLTDITAEEWATHLKELQNAGMSGARCNRVHAVASAIYSVALKWQYVLHNPLTLVPYEEESLKDFCYWTFEETNMFFEWAIENSCNFGLYHVLYELGLRISEAVGLKWDCIDFNSGSIMIRRAYSREAGQLEDKTKSGRKRILGMSAGIRSTLIRLRQNSKSDFVFSNTNGNPLRYERVREAFEKDQLKAGLKNPICLHDLRHTFASHFVMRGGNIYDLKALLGHSDIGTTMRYAHLAEGHLTEKAALVQLQLLSKNNVVKLA